MKKLMAFTAILFLVSLAVGQEHNQKVPIVNAYVRCGTLVQPESGKIQHNVLITIQGERIREVQEGAPAPSGGQVIDLSDHTCLPGLIDTHTHALLQGDITAADYDEQLLKQSNAYRAILGTRSVRRALDYGFTTIRRRHCLTYSVMSMGFRIVTAASPRASTIVTESRIETRSRSRF